MMARDLREEMRFVVDSGRVPGIVVAAGTSERTAFLEACGHAQTLPTVEPMHASTMFDLASVSKSVATATLAAVLAEQELLSEETPVADAIPELSNDAKGKITLAELLTHTSGLAAWRALCADAWEREAVIRRLLAEPLVRPPSTEREYSCLGFILLGLMLERIGGAPLDELVRRTITGPLAMMDTTYCPSPALAARCAATEVRAGRALPCRGEVHDENANALGGVSGNAGLFSTASDLSRFARMMLRGGELDGARLMGKEAFRLLFTRDPSGPAGYHWRGWVGVAPDDATSEVFSPQAFGHTGFTGTSLWCDPGQDLFVVCLTNGVHPKRECLERIGEVRLAVYAAAREHVAGSRH